MVLLTGILDIVCLHFAQNIQKSASMLQTPSPFCKTWWLKLIKKLYMYNRVLL